MSDTGAEATEAIDFALAAYRDDGEWQVSPLPHRAATDLDVLVRALRQLPSDVGTIGMVSVDDEYFLLARVGVGHLRLMLSDVGAAMESPLAMAVIESLRLPPPDDEDDTVQPAGDLSILEDLGLAPVDLGMMCDDEELYPDEVLSDIARRLGFGEPFDDALDEVQS